VIRWIAPITPFDLSIGNVTRKENAPHLQVRWTLFKPNQYNQNDKRKRSDRLAAILTNRSLQRA